MSRLQHPVPSSLLIRSSLLQSPLLYCLQPNSSFSSPIMLATKSTTLLPNSSFLLRSSLLQSPLLYCPTPHFLCFNSMVVSFHHSCSVFSNSTKSLLSHSLSTFPNTHTHTRVHASLKSRLFALKST